MNNHLPTISDLEAVLREKPELRAQASAKGIINSSSLPDALRLKTEAIQLREKLRQSKASLDHYAATREQSKQALDHGQKTLDALKTCRAKPAARPAAKAPAPATSATPLFDQFNAMAGPERTAFYRTNERAIRLEILRNNSPDAIIPNS